MIKRVAAAAFLAVLGSAGAFGPAEGGTRAYDMGTLLFEDHPFATRDPLPPVVARPVQEPAPPQSGMPAQPIPPAFPSYETPRAPAGAPPAQVRPSRPWRGSQASPDPSRLSAIAPAAGPASPPGNRILSEMRVGLLAHDIGPFSSNEEGGVDGNLELLFVSPDFLDIVWSPRPHVGFTLNSEGDTSQLYAGLSWEWSFWGGFFAGFSLGGAVHSGKTETDRVDRKELGCRLLFRESVEVGYRFGGRHSVSGMLDHVSNANICDKNEGLETVGIRYGYSF